jgi:hypothetical protein
LSNRFEVFDCFAACHRGQHVIFLCLSIVRDDHTDRTADDLRRSVTEQPLSRTIPREDRAFEILADDRVFARGDDGRKMPRVALEALGGCDVPGDIRCADDGPVGGSDRRNGQRDLNEPVVPRATNRLVVVDAFTRADPPEDVVFLFIACRRNNQADRLANRFCRGVPEDPLGGAVP